jgi:hypothetical protein
MRNGDRLRLEKIQELSAFRAEGPITGRSRIDRRDAGLGLGVLGGSRRPVPFDNEQVW